MQLAGPLPPVDPHDLRLGMRKIFGWEVIAAALGAAMCLAFAVMMRRLPREIRDVSGGVFQVVGDFAALFGVSLLASTCGNWSREREARRGARASWGNTFDGVDCLMLVAAVVRAALASGAETRWIGVVPAGMLGLEMFRLGARRRRAHAPTPAERTEATFE